MTASDSFGVLVVSPVRNEASHIQRVIRAVAAQTRPPDLWLIADDGSDDDTPDLVRKWAQRLDFLRLIELAPKPVEGGDRLASALEVIAFNHALSCVDHGAYTHIGKLDGDIELPPDYFERLLAAFWDDPGLGIAGGSIVEPTGPRGSWRAARVPEYHVHGALKLYARECFEAIGGLPERLAWDTIDETYARMAGYRTRSVGALAARHHRPRATADGKLRGRARHGECAYILRYGLPWTLLRSFKVAAMAPCGLSGFAFLGGYLRSALRSQPRVEDEQFARFVGRELRGRIVDAVLPKVRPRPTGTVHLAASFGGHLELLTVLTGALTDLERVWVTAPGPRAKALEASGEQVRPLRLVHRNAPEGIAANVWRSLRLVLCERPRLVVTSGATSVVAFCLFARLLGAQLVFIETTARVTGPSTGGRLLAPLSSLVLVQWPEMAAVYPGAILCRASLFEGQDPAPAHGEGTLVAVGSHTDPFDRMLRLVDRAVERGVLPQPVRAQSGACTYDAENFECRPWLTPEELAEAARCSRYVVCHGGSGIIAAALRRGRKPLTLARRKSLHEHVDDHQLQLTGKLNELGLAVALDEEITPEHLSAADAGPASLDVVLRGEVLEDFLRRALALASAGRPLSSALVSSTVTGLQARGPRKTGPRDGVSPSLPV